MVAFRNENDCLHKECVHKQETGICEVTLGNRVLCMKGMKAQIL